MKMRIDYSKDPKNLDEAMLMLESTLNKESKEALKEGHQPDFFFGMGMRNNWHMWDIKSPMSIYFKSIGIFHADDMCGIVIESLKRKLKNEPIDLESQVKFYKEYWEKSNAGEPIIIEVEALPKKKFENFLDFFKK